MRLGIGPRVLPVAAIVAVALVGRAVAADADAKLAGDWQLKITTDDGQTLTPKLKLTEENGKFKAVLVGVEGKDVQAEDVVVKGKDLSFKVTLELQGTSLVAKFAVKQDPNGLKGSLDYDFGGQSGTLAVAGTRPEGGPQKLHEGTWTLEILTEDGQTLKTSLKLSGAADKLAGTFTSADGTEAKIDEATLKNEELAFKVTLDFQGSPLVAQFKLKGAGEGCKGSGSYDLGGQAGTFEVVGKRAAAAKPKSFAQALVGKWEFDVTADDGGTTKATVTFTAEGDDLSGVITLPDGREVTIEDAKFDGNELTFAVSTDLNGVALVAKLKGKVDGNNIKGDVDVDVSGNKANLQFTGKKGENTK